MPLGIVSDSDFESELTNSGDNNRVVQKTPLVDQTTIEEPVITSDVIIKRHQNYIGEDGGRNPGDVNVPQSLRKLIGDTSIYDGRKDAVALAHEMGISPSSVSAYTYPQSSSNNLSDTNKNDLTNFLTNRKQKISKRAINKLAMAINMIDEGKLKERSAVELSNVAKNMAQVVKAMEPSSDGGDKQPAVQFVMFAPQVKNELHYDTVIAKDNY